MNNCMTKESYGSVYFKEPSCLDTYKMYVGNLAPETTDQDLRGKFEKYGPVIEASALPGKGFGFVHMANEDVGAKAMKSLYKTYLHGKEMIIQPAVNPKRAQQYHSNKRYFGRGAANIDNFDDKDRQYDQCQYIEREIANVISAETPPMAQSPTNEMFVPSLGGFKVVGSNSNSNNFETTNNNFNLTNGIGSTNSSISNGNNGLFPNGGSSKLNLSSAWSMSCNTNTTKDLIGCDLNSRLDNAGNLGYAGTELVGKVFMLTNKLSHCQKMLNNSPNNVGIIEQINQLQKELSLLQSQQSLADQLAKEQALLHQDNLTKMIQQQIDTDKQKQLQISSLGNPSQMVNSNTLSSIGISLPNSGHSLSNLPLSGSKSIFSSAQDGGNSFLNYSSASMDIGFPLSNSNNAFNSFAAGDNSAILPSNSSILSGTNGSSAPSNNGTVTPNNYLCGLCNITYDTGDHLPKILGCTHTFCLRCLQLSAAMSGDELRCPGNCGLSTQLSAAGVAGLTTNQGIIKSIVGKSDVPNLQQTLNTIDNNEEVCATCTSANSNANINSPSACRDAGHTLVRAQDAIALIVTKLRPIIQESISALQDAMAIRADIKRRVEYTMASLEKFLDEMRNKNDRESAEDGSLLRTLNELIIVRGNLDKQTYQELVRTYHMVDTCAKEIKSQYSSCIRTNLLNKSVKTLTLEAHEIYMGKLAKLGVNRSEVFDFEKSLISHATDGNYANVLLQYIVSDLLNSRATASNLFPYDGNSCESSSVVVEKDALSGCASLEMINENNAAAAGGMYTTSLTASSSATPDISSAAAIVDNMDNLDINSVIQTTERIEAENNSMAKQEMYLSDPTALGLNNICHIMSSNNNNGINSDNDDNDKTFLDGSPCSPRSAHEALVAAAANHGDPLAANNNVIVAAEVVHNSACSSSSSDSGIVSTGTDNSVKPFSYVDAAKKPAKPQPEAPPKLEIMKLPTQIKQQVKSPHCWMKIAVDGKVIGRVVFQLRPDKAPKMCDNFIGLCTGTEEGLGYKGTHFFKNGDGFLAGGDVEYDDGTGGYSIFDNKKFEADLCPLKDEVGMIRFKGNGTSDAGRGMVGSQFMIWYAEREFKKFAFSLVFGRVVDGMDVIKKAAEVNLAKHDVNIEDCGAQL